MGLPVVAAEDCTLGTEGTHHGRILWCSDSALVLRPAGILLRLALRLCVLLLLRQNRLRGEGCWVGCLVHGLLEWDGRRTCANRYSGISPDVASSAYAVLFICLSASSASSLVANRTNPNPRLRFVSRSLTTTWIPSASVSHIAAHHTYRLLDIAKALEAFVQRIVGCVPGEASVRPDCQFGPRGIL
jgi:hypothetical protein